MMMGDSNLGVKNILPLIKEGTVGAEIGVWQGTSSEKFLSRKVKKLYLIDTWSISGYVPASNNITDGTFNYENYYKKYSKIVGTANPDDFESFYDKIHQSVIDRFAKNPEVVVCRMNSEQWSQEYPNAKLDWIYIDGDHSYTGAMIDLKVALKALKKGGLLLGDDYGNKVGVKQAVDEFVKDNGFKLKLLGDNQFQILR